MGLGPWARVVTLFAPLATVAPVPWVPQGPLVSAPISLYLWSYLKKDANDRRVQRIKDGIKAREHNLIIGNMPENGKWESRKQA